MKSFLIHIGTDFPAILFFILLLWHIRRTETEENDLISKEDGLSLRGMAALLVLLHHLAPSTENGLLLPKFYSVGAGGIAVSLFFFLSGYGLQKQYIINGESYRKSFLKKRIPTILIPLALFTVLYWLVYYSIGKVYTIQDMVADIRIGVPFVAYSWYLIALLLFYLFFWISMSVFKEHTRWMPIAACGWYILYALTCIKLKYLIFWYDTAHLLPVGMFCAEHEKKILDVLKKRSSYSALVLTAFSCWLVISFVFAHVWPINIYLYYILSISHVFLSTVVIVLLHLKIKIGNPVLRYFGKNSMEIYLIHGLIFYLLRGDIFYLNNEPLYCLLSLSIVILIASILAPVDRFLLRSWKRIVK